MKTHTIPLVPQMTARGWAKSIGTSAKDAQVINGLYEVSANPLVGSKTVFLQKRAGSTTGSFTYGSGVIKLKYYGALVDAGYATSSALYSGNATSLGALTASPASANNYIVAEAVIGSKGVSAFVTTDGAGWFIYSDSATSNFPTFTGDRTSGSAIISGIASTTGIYPGQAISGTGIPASTRVQSVDSGTQITMTANATSGAGTSTTITKEAVSKIIDAQFPTANSMAAMDGYFFAGTSTGTVYQSAINDPSSWASSDTINADVSGDGSSFIFRHQNSIVVAGNNGTIQHFYNAGNASGSVLSAADNLTVQGITLVNQPVPFQDGGYCIAFTGSETVSSSGRNYGLFKLTGINNYQQVSDNIVSGIIVDQALSIIGHAEIGNKSLVLLHGTNDTTVLCYDPTTGMFSALSTDAAITSSIGVVFTKSGSSTAFAWATGDTWTDSSSAFTLTAQTEPIYLGGQFGGADISYELIGADTEASGTATLDVSDDGYASWRTVGAFDMTKENKILWGGGWHPGPRAYRITHSANTNFRAQALRITYQ